MEKTGTSEQNPTTEIPSRRGGLDNEHLEVLASRYGTDPKTLLLMAQEIGLAHLAGALNKQIVFQSLCEKGK